MSEVSELRDIFFNKLEKTSYGRNEIKKLFDDCYFSIHNEENKKDMLNSLYGKYAQNNNLINKLDVDKIVNDAMTLIFGNTYSPNKKIRNVISLLEKSISDIIYSGLRALLSFFSCERVIRLVFR